MHAVAAFPASLQTPSPASIKSLSPAPPDSVLEGGAAHGAVSSRAIAAAALKAVSPASQYERLESNIGEGTYGKVHKARDLKTGRVVAIKKAKASAMDRDVGGIGFTALREIKLMQAVRHPNVMACLDVFTDGGVLHLVMEFMDGDLKKVLEDRGFSDFAEGQVKCLAQQLLRGLSALHGRWFVHRDVTPTNILLSFNSGVAKLSDFGFARTLGHDDRPMTGSCTTLWYRAPELLYGAKFYGQSVDLWSTGCVIGEMFLRQALFQGRGEFDMLAKVFEKRGTPTEEVWRDVSALPTYVEFSHHPQVPMSTILPNASRFAHLLVESLLTLDPKQRPSAAGALDLEFFSSSAAWPPACPPQELPFVLAERERAGGL
jgi:cyclin-dependent kinase 7